MDFSRRGAVSGDGHTATLANLIFSIEQGEWDVCDAGQDGL